LSKIVCAFDPDEEALLGSHLLVENLAALAQGAIDARIPAEKFRFCQSSLLADPSRLSCARFAANEQRTFPGS
jgi:hypothetical protein